MGREAPNGFFLALWKSLSQAAANGGFPTSLIVGSLSFLGQKTLPKCGESKIPGTQRKSLGTEKHGAKTVAP